ncbi:isochorismatase family protein [Natronococcus wangiae]|uniref:isochorismatase family protein n=1 Tax=Natronococcus wangiae TaxID=3068275 RepID=UPI00273DA488|nr:isochorismatase family protein [Natronococcus sp. AD5]
MEQVAEPVADSNPLVLVGVTSSRCIRAAAVDSLQHGYRTLVPANAISDRAEGPY